MQLQRQKKKRVDFDLTQFSGDARAEMEKMYDETMKSFTEGSIVQGKVLDVRGNEVLVDIGYKSEGAIPVGEFRDAEDLKAGDEFDVLLVAIEDDDGMVILSKEQADEKLRWERIESSHKEGSVVLGTVKGRVRGGLIVDLDGVEAFLPGSQVDASPVHSMDNFVGNEYEFKILKMSPERRNIIVSRRALIEETLKEKKAKLLGEIEVGQKRRGIVKNITDFGAFVDLDGLDGLLHITDMSWGRVRHASEVVKVGEELEIVVLDIDRERERVSLGLKQRSPNPWDNIAEKYPVGSRLRGKVVNLVPYGAFVELEEGVEGLVHVSEMSWTKRIARASDILEVGEIVDIAVLTINKEEQKIALGMRQTEENPWDAAQSRYPVGSRISGEVRNFTSFGAFVELEDGIDGMIHVSDMSWTRKVNHPSEVLEKGQKVDAIVLEVDAQNQRISLGLKQAQDDPWNTIAGRYTIGEIVSGKVSKIASFGAFVEIEEGIDGLVHISEIADQHVEQVRDVLDVGQDVTARIVRIDRAERRIGLSIRAAGMADEEFAKHQEEIIVEGLKPGEEMVDLAGAFDQALGLGGSGQPAEEWRPGADERKKNTDEGDGEEED